MWYAHIKDEKLVELQTGIVSVLDKKIQKISKLISGRAILYVKVLAIARAFTYRTGRERWTNNLSY